MNNFHKYIVIITPLYCELQFCDSSKDFLPTVPFITHQDQKLPFLWQMNSGQQLCNLNGRFFSQQKIIYFVLVPKHDIF